MQTVKKYFYGIVFSFTIFWMGIFTEDILAAGGNFNQAAYITISAENDYPHTKQAVWISYKALNPGYITVTAAAAAGSGSSGGSGEIQLYDAKKMTALSGIVRYHTDSTSSGYTVSYGVKKNTTYYFLVKAQGAVSLGCKFTKVKESSGNKKAKARALTKKKQSAGVIAAGDKTADWYKIKVKKKQILHLYYSGKTNEKLLFTFSGKFLNTAKRYITYGDEKVHHSYSLERVQPGTYYVKVQPSGGGSCGYYTIKWK